jgi:hypothetical protein
VQIWKQEKEGRTHVSPHSASVHGNISNQDVQVMQKYNIKIMHDFVGQVYSIISV